MNFRIIKIKNYVALCSVEKETLWGWSRVYSGTESECNAFLDNCKKYGTDDKGQIILRKETL